MTRPDYYLPTPRKASNPRTARHDDGRVTLLECRESTALRAPDGFIECFFAGRSRIAPDHELVRDLSREERERYFRPIRLRRASEIAALGPRKIELTERGV
jgi:hypothetical protein